MEKQYNFSALYHDTGNKHRLLVLLSRFLKPHQALVAPARGGIPVRDDILALFINNLSDKTIIKCLVYFSNSVNNDKSSYNQQPGITKKTIARAAIYKEIIKESNININKYLDIGSNNGLYTVALGELLGLSRDKIFGIDLGEFAGMKIIPIDGFVYKDYNGIDIPYPDNSFDLVTMFMVFHHVREPLKLLGEIHRVLKKGGVLLLREHDSENNKMFENLFTLEHYLYNIFYDKIKFDNFYKDYHENYYSKVGLIDLMEKSGFKLVNQNKKYTDRADNYYKLNNPTNYYQIMFTKI